MLTSLTQLKLDQLLALDPNEVDWALSAEEIFYLWAVFNGSWFYDYQALEQGRPGYHAQLKSDFCSDGFFMSRAVLKYLNWRQIIAKQMVRLLEEDLRMVKPRPTNVCGIPEGAKLLGDEVAKILGLPTCDMIKDPVTGKLLLVSEIAPGGVVLKVEDFCSEGTGFKESTGLVYSAQPLAHVFSHEVVILNRGGHSAIQACGKHFGIAALVTRRVNSWDPKVCPLCKRGSRRIKPKATDENWQIITTAQKAA
jgi:hypothetical protein